MKFHRIYAIVLRYLYLFRYSLDRLTDAFYWPTLDLLIWGLTSSYFNSMAPDGPNIVVMTIAGLLFWLIVWRAQYEVSVNVLEDLWNKNLINIFAAPLRFSEWVISFILLGFFKALISFGFTMVLAYFLYKVQFFMYGFHFIPIILLLFMTGWWVGFLVGGLILRYGTRIQTLAWALIYVLSPFSAIYYPVSILPEWAQTVAMFVPTSYVFEASREILATGTLDSTKLVISFILNSVYLVLSLMFFKKCFNVVMDRGLVSVE